MDLHCGEELEKDERALGNQCWNKIKGVSLWPKKEHGHCCWKFACQQRRRLNTEHFNAISSSVRISWERQEGCAKSSPLRIRPAAPWRREWSLLYSGRRICWIEFVDQRQRCLSCPELSHWPSGPLITHLLSEDMLTVFSYFKITQTYIREV